MTALTEMLDAIANNYVLIVLAMFLFVVALEVGFPLARLKQSITTRWLRNFALGMVDAVSLRATGLIFGVLLAAIASERQIGLLNNLSISPVTIIVLSFLLLDLKQWFFHWLMHQFSWLWKVHQVHHSDGDFDLSTGLRFHPVESVLSQLMFFATVFVFGIALEAIILRGALIYFVNFFTHANVNVHRKLDHALRLLLVTPAMHRIHHSKNTEDTNSNFGVVFAFWDRLFGTYRGESASGEALPEVGLAMVAHSEQLGIWRLLLLPFKQATSPQADN